jgi:hypothetical protein
MILKATYLNLNHFHVTITYYNYHTHHNNVFFG